MPRSVLEHLSVDHTAPAGSLADLIARITSERIELERREEGANGDMPDDDLELEEPNVEELEGPPSMFTCPDCNGALWELTDGDALRYRCHVGHAWGPESLLAGQSEQLEDAVWAAYRALRESAMLAKRLAARSLGQGLPGVSKQYELRHDEAMARADLLSGILERGRFVVGDRQERELDSTRDA